jgi:hypothetical protein
VSYTTANFISSVQRRSFAPTNQLTYTEAEILAVGDEETKTMILPNILAVREEFYVGYVDQPIVAGQAAYDIHARAVGMICREVQIVDTNNAVTDLPRIEPEQVTSYAAGNPTGFYLRGDQIILDRPPSASLGTIRQFFFLRPGDLVLTTASAVISAINTGTNTVTVTAIPSTWATGNVFDFIKKDGAQNYRAIDYTSTNVASNNITFSSLPSTIVVGDYISLQGTSPLLQMPPDYWPVLAQCVAANMLRSSNQPGASEATKMADRMLEIAQKMITPRVQGEDRVVQPINWW